MGSEEYTALPQTAYAVDLKNVYEDCAVSLTNEMCIEDSLAKAIACLSDEEQRIIWMNFYGDYKLEEIAIEFGKSKRWITTLKVQALAKLKKILGEEQ